MQEIDSPYEPVTHVLFGYVTSCCRGWYGKFSDFFLFQYHCFIPIFPLTGLVSKNFML